MDIIWMWKNVNHAHHNVRNAKDRNLVLNATMHTIYMKVNVYHVHHNVKNVLNQEVTVVAKLDISYKRVNAYHVHGPEHCTECKDGHSL
jgi:hypothetical protein